MFAEGQGQSIATISSLRRPSPACPRTIRKDIGTPGRGFEPAALVLGARRVAGATELARRRPSD
jgi:hypothetical protein